MNNIQFPHCDPRVVHSPGSCEYCDNSGLQPIREAWNIAFTGRPEEGKTPCPGEVARGENLEHWSGNRARPSLDSVARHLEGSSLEEDLDDGDERSGA